MTNTRLLPVLTLPAAGGQGGVKCDADITGGTAN